MGDAKRVGFEGRSPKEIKTFDGTMDVKKLPGTSILNCNQFFFPLLSFIKGWGHLKGAE